MSTRDDLIFALLADPTDMLLRYALADAIEEEGTPHVGALVRVMPALCRALPIQSRVKQAGSYLAKPFRFLAMPNLNLNPKNEKWRGLRSIGRLAGIAAAHLAVRDLITGEARTALLRHLLSCELYAVRVVDARQRDFLGYESKGEYLLSLGGHQPRTHFWGLRGGSAGIAIQAMQVCEQMHLHSVYGRWAAGGDFFNSVSFAHWRTHNADARSTFAQIRLRHLAILDCLASLKEPWAAALALYHEHRQKVKEEFDRDLPRKNKALVKAYQCLKAKSRMPGLVPGLPEDFFNV